jgi:hypothetical protein
MKRGCVILEMASICCSTADEDKVITVDCNWRGAPENQQINEV